MTFVLAFVVPIVLAMVLGTSAAIRLAHWGNAPMFVRLLATAIIPPLTIFVYFWVWQRIEESQRVAGEEAFMGPMVFLIYGFPIFLAFAFASIWISVAVFLRHQ